MKPTPEPAGLQRRALLSRSALDAALSRALRENPDAVLDLRADAYGHGATVVHEHARALGAQHFLLHESADSVAPPAHLLVQPYGYDTQPVLRLEGEVVAVKTVPDGSPVSYGYSYRTRGTSTLALVGLGYADGVPRLASNRARVRIGSATGVVAGRIAMDQLVVDLATESTAIGEIATLWEDAVSLAAWCTATDRSPGALTARLGPRIARTWVDS